MQGRWLERLNPTWVLPLLPAAVALLLLGLVMWAAERIVGGELAQRAEQRVAQVARLYADQLAQDLLRRHLELEGVASLLRVGASEAAVRQEIDRLKAASEAYVWIGVTDAAGTVRLATDGLLQGRSIATRPVFARSLEAPWFGTFHAPLALREPLQMLGRRVPEALADLGVPARRAAGDAAAPTLAGVVVAHLDRAHFDRLRQHVLGPAAARRSLDLLLAEPDGQVVLGSSPAWTPPPRAPEFDPSPRRLSDREGEDHVVVRLQVDAATTPLRADWDVIALQPLDSALLPVTQLRWQLMTWGGLAVLLIGSGGYWVSQRLSRPYREMLDAVALQAGTAGQVAAPGATLRIITEQLRRLPLPAAQQPPGAALLSQVVHDANRLEAVLAHLPAPVYLLDGDMRVVYWNRACAQTFGWTAGEVTGRQVAEFLQPALPDSQVDAVRHDMRVGAGPWQFEATMRHRSGRTLIGEWRVTRVLGIDGAPLGLLAQVHDRTAEREAEERLREQAEIFGAVVDAASDAIVGVDLDGRVNLFNPAAERIFGRAAATMLGQPLDALLPPGPRATHRTLMERFAEGRVSSRPMGYGRVRGLRSDGTVLELEASISQFTVRGTKRLTAILRDVTERVRADQMLAQTQLELSELTQRLMDQEKLTSRRVAQTLHDQLGQTLGALRLSFDAMSMRLPAGDERIGAVRDRVGTLIDEAIGEVREALADLRPPMLEEAGLAAALDNEVRVRAAEPDAPAFRLEVEAGLQALRWPSEVEYAVFMVAREALVNALLHARAQVVVLQLRGDAHRLALVVEDDGLGVPADAAGGRPGHLGLVGMRERALAIGATWRIEAADHGGTRVVLTWLEAGQEPDRRSLPT